jgi:K+/H+ antiporter YhaU regulatory subunit KhtT
MDVQVHTDSAKVVVNPTPQVTITNNDDSICSGEAAILH